jgi:hypothetical protein
MLRPTLLQQRLPLPIRPKGGAAGTVVRLSAEGLPPSSRLLIAFANLSQYQLLQRVTTDENGSFITAQEVPEWAELNRVHYFFASFDDEIPLALSSGFHVTAENGIARVTGSIGERADGCVDLRDAKNELYHLEGDLGERKPGDRVTVVGTIADPTACGGAGIAIAVSDFRVLPG